MKRTATVSLLFMVMAAVCLAAPAYNASPAIACTTGQTVNLWSAETPTPGASNAAASQQVVLNNSNPYKNGTPFSVDGKFSGAPGTFEVDVQVSATDVDANYQTCQGCNMTTVDATNNTFHLDYSGNAKFARLLMRTRTNSVTVTATITGG